MNFSTSKTCLVARLSTSKQCQLRNVLDDYAFSEHRGLCHLRAEGVIPEGLLFQVLLPMSLNVLGRSVEPAWTAIVANIHEEALLAALRRIQDHIPAGNLVDLALEFVYLEGIAATPTWFAPVKEGILQRILRVAAAVDDGVALGSHLCYGDLGHKHFVQPKDTAVLVEVGNAILKGATRPVDWIHLPVPKSSVDAASFAPLEPLALGTELYLGLLHPDGEERTREMTKAALGLSDSLGLRLSVGLGDLHSWSWIIILRLR